MMPIDRLADMEEKLRILEDLNMIYIRQIALSLKACLQDEARIPTISKDALSCRWKQAASAHRAVLQHPGIVHRPKIPNKNVEELPLVWFDADVTAIYCTSYYTDSWRPCQLGKTCSHCLLVICTGESDNLSQSADDCLAHSVHNVVHSRLRDVIDE
ncbi:hypothetical protein F2P79_018178 [Pimephales promelas]|nr:hypothetical protein F2P79_018178 [Pimephales promelas]